MLMTMIKKQRIKKIERERERESERERERIKKNCFIIVKIFKYKKK